VTHESGDPVSSGAPSDNESGATVHFLDDLVPGQRFAGGTPMRIDADRAAAFAAEFDPQPFRLDENAAASRAAR
jgi:acyl dehydratase